MATILVFKEIISSTISFFFFRFLSSPDKYGASYDLYMKIFLDDLKISNFVIKIL